MFLRNIVIFAMAMGMLCLLATAGCSGANGGSILPKPDNESLIQSTEIEAQNDAQSGRMLWGVWQFTFDESSGELTPIPLREAYAHFNVTPFLLPPDCNDCLKIKVNSFDTVTRILDADVTLRNPTQLTGHDVRGILYTNDYGHSLTNADDWTGLWDIAGGQTINPFKAFAKLVDHRAFAPGFEDTEKYLIYIPIPPHWEKITFAADASWPGNCKEPYEITNFWQETIYNTTGSSGNIYIDVHDWQGDVNNVVLFASTITGETFTTFEQVSADTWGVHLTNNTGAVAGDYKVRLRASSKDAGSTRLHDYVTLSITEYHIPVVASIHPDKAKAGNYLTNVIVSGSGFEGPGAQVKLKMIGKPNIVADNLIVVEESTITCDINIPIDATPGMYDVEVTNGNNFSGSGVELFEVLEPLTPNVTGINPDNATYGHDLSGITVSGTEFEGPGAQVKLKMNGQPDIISGNVSVINESTITCDISIPIDAALGFYDVEVTNGNSLSGTGKKLFEVHGPLTPNVEGINPDMATQGHPLSGVIVSGSGFEGPGTQVKLKTDGKPDIVADNVLVLEESTITCNINIPSDATPGFYDVEVINWSGSSSVGKGLFEIVEATQFNPVDVTPPWLNFSPYGVCIDGNYAYIAGDAYGLHIFDISDLSNPTWVNRVDTPGSARNMTIAGDYAYVADYDAGLLIYDITSPGSPYIVKTIDTPGYAYDVVVSGGYAYVADDVKGFQIIAIDPPDSAHIVKNIDTPGYCRGLAVIPGSYVYVADGYAGLQIIDITLPESAFIVKTVDTPGAAYDVAISAGYAYVADYHSGLQIINITLPESAFIVKEVDTPGAAKAVLVSGIYAYVTDSSKGLQIINVASPETAFIAKTVDASGDAWGIFISGQYAYIACQNSVHIIDIDPVDSAHVFNTIWTLFGAYSATISGGYAYVANYYGALQIVDIAWPESASIVKGVDTAGKSLSVDISAGYAFVADYNAGLQIIDIDPPNSANIVKTVDTPGYAAGVALSGGYAYLADSDEGLQIIDIDPPDSAFIIKTVDTPGMACRVVVAGGYAYVADYDNAGFLIIDISLPESASIVKTVDTPGNAFGVAISGEYAYVADSDEGLQIIDIDPPDSAYIMKTVDTSGDAKGAAVSGGYAYVTNWYDGLKIIDIIPPGSAYIVKTIDTPGSYATDSAISNGYAYVPDPSWGMCIYKLW